MTADCKWFEFNKRLPSVHRRHGDPFPLPRLGSPTEASPLDRRLDYALGALNSLASADFFQAGQADLPLTCVQLQMMESLADRISSYADMPDGLCEEAALRDLKCGANLYGQEAVNCC